MPPLTILADWFFGTLILLFVFIPLVIVWVFTLLDLAIRNDLRGWQIAMWLLVIILFPLIGVLIYFLVRPDSPEVKASL